VLRTEANDVTIFNGFQTVELKNVEIFDICSVPGTFGYPEEFGKVKFRSIVVQVKNGPNGWSGRTA